MQAEAGIWLNGPHPLFAAVGETVARTVAKAGEHMTAPDFGLFDGLLVIVIGLGLWRGKVRGISEELLDFLQWVVIVVAAGFLYPHVGDLLVQAGLQRLSANIGGYVLIAILVVTLFSFIKKSVGNKLVESDFFGSWEYRLGMVAGAVRYFCIWVVFLALLSSRYFDAAAVAAERKYQEKEVGLVLVPTWGMAQRMALHDSLTGPYLRQYLAYVLMRPMSYAKGGVDNNTLGKQQQRVLDDVTNAPKPVPPPTPPEKK
jgi:uncharacterized membrane protein required for colicin V production